MKRGIFITFEGIDGSGKSTQIKRIFNYLMQKNTPVTITREPGGTEIGEQIRAIILSPEFKNMSDQTELLLYLASRSQHIAEVIRPALSKGNVVLCDRFHHATIAYQGYGRQGAIDSISALSNNVLGEVSIQRVYLFDISVEDAMLRLKSMQKDFDRLELSTADFYERVRSGYLALAEQEKKIFMHLDATQSVDDIFNIVRRDIDKLLKYQIRE